jgi:hypothetical protein
VGLLGQAHGGHSVGQAGHGEGFQGVVDPLLGPAEEVGEASLQLHLPRGHGPGGQLLLEAAHPEVEPALYLPGQKEEGEPLGALRGAFGPGGDQGVVGEARSRGEVLVPVVKPVGLSLPPRQGAVGPQVASSLDLRHPGGPVGLPVKEFPLHRTPLGGVLVKGVGHLVGDGEDAVQSPVGQKVAQGVVQGPAPALVGGADHGAELFQKGPLRRGEQGPVYAVAVQVVHQEAGRGEGVHVVGHLQDLLSHQPPKGGKLLLGQARSKSVQDHFQVRVQGVVVLALAVKDGLHPHLLFARRLLLSPSPRQRRPAALTGR